MIACMFLELTEKKRVYYMKNYLSNNMASLKKDAVCINFIKVYFSYKASKDMTIKGSGIALN